LKKKRSSKFFDHSQKFLNAADEQGIRFWSLIHLTAKIGKFLKNKALQIKIYF